MMSCMYVGYIKEVVIKKIMIEPNYNYEPKEEAEKIAYKQANSMGILFLLTEFSIQLIRL